MTTFGKTTPLDAVMAWILLQLLNNVERLASRRSLERVPAATRNR
jgi:hypothetical protein